MHGLKPAFFLIQWADDYSDYLFQVHIKSLLNRLWIHGTRFSKHIRLLWFTGFMKPKLETFLFVLLFPSENTFISWLFYFLDVYVYSENMFIWVCVYMSVVHSSLSISLSLSCVCVCIWWHEADIFHHPPAYSFAQGFLLNPKVIHTATVTS